MWTHANVDDAWRRCLEAHASEPLIGEKGPYKPIGSKSMALLSPLWKAWEGKGLDLGALLAAGKDVRVFADPHFEHANIIGMCHRPFDSIESMDEVLWRNIAKACQEADFVVCLGDWAMKNPIFWQRRFASLAEGRQACVVGNHDAKGAKPEQWALAGARASLAFSVGRELLKAWVCSNDPELGPLVDWDAIPASVNVGLSHWPVPPSRLPGPGWLNMHGHIHDRIAGPLRINCSVEAIGYAPVSIPSLFGSKIADELSARSRGLPLADQDSASGSMPSPNL